MNGQAMQDVLLMMPALELPRGGPVQVGEHAPARFLGDHGERRRRTLGLGRKKDQADPSPARRIERGQFGDHLGHLAAPVGGQQCAALEDQEIDMKLGPRLGELDRPIVEIDRAVDLPLAGQSERFMVKAAAKAVLASKASSVSVAASFR